MEFKTIQTYVKQIIYVKMDNLNNEFKKIDVG